jgi:DNA-binding NarL/FixJ family response regulator
VLVDAPLNPTQGAQFWLHARGELDLIDGRMDDAIAAADEVARRQGPITNPAWTPWRSLKARALDGLGRTDEAIALVREELEHARVWGAPETVGRTLRVLGTLERDGGIDHLRESVELLAASPAKLELAKALAALGSSLRRARHPSDAREPLRQALELADQCSAGALAEHARAELYASGARPRTDALSGVAALTASERRVAGLAVEGRTNRDIAQALFVTPKTVEVHLSNAYRKLGIRSRRELPAELVG